MALARAKGLNLDLHMNKCFLLIALAAAIPAMAWAQNAGISVETSLNQEQYIPYEEATLSVKIYNISGQTVEFGREKNWITFSVQNDDNSEVVSLAEVPIGQEFSVRSGEIGIRRFNLTPYFAFRQTGRYKVTITVRVPKWNLEIVSTPATFLIMTGTPIPGLPDLVFGVPQSGTNAPPEVRRYTLTLARNKGAYRLFFRLSDEGGGQTIQAFMLGQIVSFAKPEALIDTKCNLHTLYQSGARMFSYFVIDPNGAILARQTYDYTDTRPALRMDEQGRIYVAGGARHYTTADLPAAEPPPTMTQTNASNATNASGQ